MGHEVKRQMYGQKIECNHPLYHFKRQVWNSNVDRYPAVIFECKNDEDVIRAVHYANKNGLKITVRGGGFHPAGKSVKDGAVLIDLSQMNDVHVDEISKTVTVGAGAKIYEVDTITQEYGLAVPLGMVSNIGVSGLALGGGLGYLRGKYGLTCDNVVGVHVVTGEGKLLYVNRLEHAELFWSIRGAGENFGIVTKLEMNLHPVGRHVLGIDVLYDFKDLQKIIKRVEEYRQSAVDEVSFNIAISKGDNGEVHIRLIGMYVGELNLRVEREIIQPLLEFATPIIDNTEILLYTDMQKKFDSLVGNSFAIEGISLFFEELGDEVVQMLISGLEKANGNVVVHLLEIHGKVNRISKYETAFAIRDASYLLVIDADIGSDPVHTKLWVQEMYDKLLPYSYKQVSYFNSSKVSEEVIQNSYSCIINQLVQLKLEYDPDNLFCSEHKLLDRKR